MDGRKMIFSLKVERTNAFRPRYKISFKGPNRLKIDSDTLKYRRYCWRLVLCFMVNAQMQ